MTEAVECPAADTYQTTQFSASLESETLTIQSATATIQCTEVKAEVFSYAWDETTPSKDLPAEFIFVGDEEECAVVGKPFTFCLVEGRASGDWLTKGGLAYTKEGDGTLVLNEDVRVYIFCSFFTVEVDCTYSSEAVNLDFVGGNPGKVGVSEQSLAETSGEVCPWEEVTLDAAFELSPSPVFVSSTATPNTIMCAINEAACPSGKKYPIENAFKAGLESNVKFTFEYESSKKEPVCASSSIAGSTRQEGSSLLGSLTSLSFSECGGGLCNISAVKLPYDRVVFKTSGSGNGTMRWIHKFSVNGPIAFQITSCPTKMKCVYGTTTPVSEVPFTLTGGAPAKLTSGAVKLKAITGSDAQCSSSATWEGVAEAGGIIKYKFLSPSPLFLTS